MVDEDEANCLADGFPQEIEDAISDRNLSFTVNRSSHHLKAFQAGEEIFKDDLRAILFWPSALWPFWLESRHESYGVRAHPGNQLAACVVKRADHLAIGIISISQKDELLFLANLLQECACLVDQGFAGTVGFDDSLVNPGTNRHAEVVRSHATKHSESLEGMPHDKMRFGIGLGLLMKVLHRGHLAAFFGVLQAIENKDRALIDAVNGEALENG